MKNKTAVITGGAGGIGYAIAMAFAEAGANVVIADMNTEAGERSADQLRKRGQDHCAEFILADITKPEEVSRLMSATAERYGGIDVLVNNAGLQYVSPVVKFPEERWNQLIGVILTGSFLCSKYALPYMIERQWGRVIMIASTQGKVATPFKSAYVAAKHGLIGLSKTIALEVAADGITCNAICPAFTRTALVEKQISEVARNNRIANDEVVQKLFVGPAAIKRLLEPEEIAAMAMYLCSDAAAGITGAALDIDLGWTAS